MVLWNHTTSVFNWNFRSELKFCFSVKKNEKLHKSMANMMLMVLRSFNSDSVLNIDGNQLGSCAGFLFQIPIWLFHLNKYCFFYLIDFLNSSNRFNKSSWALIDYYETILMITTFISFFSQKNATKLQRVLNKKTSAHELSATGLNKRDGIWWKIFKTGTQCY